MRESMKDKPIGAGKSSFDLIDPALLFDVFPRDRNTVFLDLACGIGKYSLALADVLGKNSFIFAIDLWPEGITSLLKEISRNKIGNIWATVGDISKRIPLDNQSIDICLMATVLHDLVEVQTQHGALEEIARVIPGIEDRSTQTAVSIDTAEYRSPAVQVHVIETELCAVESLDKVARVNTPLAAIAAIQTLWGDFR